MRLTPTVFLALMLSACAPTPPASKSKLYKGPTETIEQLVAGINANNAKIPSLFANHDFEATINDPKANQSQYVNGFGSLFYTNPNMMRLTAQKEVTALFDMGSDGTRFWFEVSVDKPSLVWGNLANADKPCVQQMPIRPDLIMQVLAIQTIDMDLLHQPVPVMHYNNDADAYVVDWQVQRQDKWVLQKEIYYDRKSKSPFFVGLFDLNGRIVLSAKLSNFQPVEVADLPKDQWPKMAASFKLLFPDNGSTMDITLNGMATQHNGRPRPSTYAKDFSESSNVTQIDEKCP